MPRDGSKSELHGREKDRSWRSSGAIESPSRSQISIADHVHRGEFYIGLRPGTSFAEKGKNVSLDVIGVDPGGALVPGRKLSVRFLRREWHSVRQAGVGGRFRWHTEREDVEVSAKEIETGRQPAVTGFVPEKSGLYLFAAEGKDGRGNPVTTRLIYVTGDDYVSLGSEDDDTVELVADAEEYKPAKRRDPREIPYERPEPSSPSSASSS
jgi:uncharacterized protein YfaS (alpha-2-macroglobulin family)